jgi:hypothetical protein
MWSELRNHVRHLLERLVKRVLEDWPDLKISVRVEEIAAAPVFADCEIFRSGLGDSVDINLEVSLPFSDPRDWYIDRQRRSSLTSE